MTKKIVIAAAGEGTRMLHLTKNKCKPLIRVENRPFLAYLLDNIFKAGYRHLILVVGYKEEKIKKFLSHYKPPLKSLRKNQYKIEMVSQYEILGPKKKEYGTACPLKCIKDIMGKSQFVFLYGDNLYSTRDLRAVNVGGKYNYVGGIYQENPEKYGVLIAEGEFLKKIVEKPKKFVGNLINTGLYKFTPEIFEKLERLKRSPRGEYEITDLINLLARQRKVKVKQLKDIWFDFGNPSDIPRFSRFLKALKTIRNFLRKNGNSTTY